jgi:TolA-binding protein
MAAMKRYLILCTLAASAASQSASPGSPPEISNVNQSSTGTSAVAKTPAGLRHLSEQERIELRRQLQQFNSQYRKRS